MEHKEDRTKRYNDHVPTTTASTLIGWGLLQTKMNGTAVHHSSSFEEEARSLLEADRIVPLKERFTFHTKADRAAVTEGKVFCGRGMDEAGPKNEFPGVTIPVTPGKKSVAIL